MQKTKIIITLVAVAAVTLALIGLAAAQMNTNQTDAGTNPNTAPNDGVWNWIGNCFGYRASQAYDNQYVAPQAPTDGSTPAPAPYQGDYNYGPCWTR